MDENNRTVKCLHCDGSGICKQLRLVTTRTEVVTKPGWEDEDRYEGDVHDYTRVWKKNKCEICGEGDESEVKGSQEHGVFFNDPDRLICRVCGGSGYVRVERTDSDNLSNPKSEVCEL